MRDYLVGLIALVSLSGIYQITVATWLTPPTITAAPVAPPKMSGGDGNLDDLFADTDWQRGRTIRLKTEDGMLLCQDCKQKDGQTWELKPITIVVGRGLNGEGSKEPILITATEGASIEFDAPLDVMSGVAPSIKRGQLRGDVVIKRSTNAASAYEIGGGSASADNAADSRLLIRTSNVGIDPRTIWTNDPIHMQVGRATMIGRVLTLHLAGSATGPRQSSDVTGTLDRMELIYLHKLTLPLDDPSQPTSSEGRGVVEVRCGNGIQYDFALDQLILEKDVELLRLASPATETASQTTPPANDWIDRFLCDSLIMTLRDPLNSKLRRDDAMDWIDRIEATGSPLRMNIRSQNFDLTAGRVLFDPVEGWLMADSAASVHGNQSNDNPINTAQTVATRVGTNESFVQLRRGDLQAYLSRLEYRFNPAEPQQLGTVTVDGAGRWLHHAADAPLRSFSWQNGLEVKPLGIATPDQMQVDFGVWCEGQLRAMLSDGGSFMADRIEGVLRPDTTSQPVRLGSNAKGTGQSSINQRWLPEKMAALGNVKIDSQSLRAQTNRMHLFFQHVAASTIQRGTGEGIGNDPIRRWVSQPDGPESAKKAAEPTREPATIRGDTVAATLTMGGGELTATDLSVSGGVEVSHPMKLHGHHANPTMMAVLTGNQLRLKDGGVGDVIELTGSPAKPARLQMGDGFFIGPKIQVRPDDNFVWVNDAGEFVLPSHMLPSLSSGAVAGNQLGRPDDSGAKWSRAPRCRFGGSLTFDGQIATLGGGVELDTVITQGESTNEIVMRGDELKWTLNAPVYLRTPASFRESGIAEIALIQTGSRPVELTVDQFARDGVRESRHHLQTSQLAWVPNANPVAAAPNAASTTSGASGTIVAPGPGSYRAWIRNAGGTSPFTPAAKEPTNQQPIKPNTPAFYPGMIEDDDVNRAGGNAAQAPSIMGVHLVFQESMRGDLLAKSLTFRRGVRVAQRTVPDFNTLVDASQMDLLSSGDLTIDCDALRVALDPSVPFQGRTMGVAATTPWEVEAAGGVLFRTRTDDGAYTVTADRCGYSAAKDLFTIFGGPTRPARFRQRTALDQPGRTFEFANATLRLKTMEVVSMPFFRFVSEEQATMDNVRTPR